MRTELRLKPKEMLDSTLKSLWATLDEDGSGFIAAGELGHSTPSLPLILAVIP